MALLQFLKESLKNDNVKAFLKNIRKCEGTDSEDGYTYLFGSSPRNTLRFSDFKDHPRIRRPFGKNSSSSAAGAYQIMQKTWDEDIQPKLKLPDFSPGSQDIACVYLISGRNALQKLMDGNFAEALDKCNNAWASLPGAPYGQPTHTIAQTENWYKENGGTIA